MHKKLVTIFGLISLVAVGAVTLAFSPINSMGGGLAEGAANGPTNYEQTFTNLVTHEGVWGLETKNGNFIKVETDGTQQDGLVTLTKGQYFKLATPIGGIWQLDLNLKVDGMPYHADDQGPAPLTMAYGYYADPLDFNSEVIYLHADKGFRDSYGWTGGPNHQTPSLLSLTALLDEVTITSMTLHYNCEHKDAESLSDPNAIYAVGSAVQQTMIGNTSTGIKLDKHNDYEDRINLTLEVGDEIYFKKSHQETLKLVMPTDQDKKVSAIDLGYISYDEETAKFTCLQAGEVTFFINTTTLVTYSVIPSESLYEWYLTGQGFKVGKTDCTGVEVDGIMPDNGPCWADLKRSYPLEKLGQNTFVARSVVMNKDAEFKLFTSTEVWRGYECLIIGNELATNAGSNIKVAKAGTYDITLQVSQFNAYIRLYDVTQD